MHTTTHKIYEHKNLRWHLAVFINASRNANQSHTPRFMLHASRVPNRCLKSISRRAMDCPYFYGRRCTVHTRPDEWASHKRASPDMKYSWVIRLNSHSTIKNRKKNQQFRDSRINEGHNTLIGSAE